VDGLASELTRVLICGCLIIWYYHWQQPQPQPQKFGRDEIAMQPGKARAFNFGFGLVGFLFFFPRILLAFAVSSFWGTAGRKRVAISISPRIFLARSLWQPPLANLVCYLIIHNRMCVCACVCVCRDVCAGSRVLSICSVQRKLCR